MSRKNNYTGHELVSEYVDGFIERLARFWPEPREQLHAGGWQATQELFELLEIEGGGKVLDICCGEGATAAFLAGQMPVSVTGVDLLHSALVQANARIQSFENTGTCRFSQANIFALPFADETFDVIYGQDPDGLAHWGRVEAFREIERVLKPGGRFGFQHWIPGPDLPEEMARAFDEVTTRGGFASHREVNADAYLAAMKQAGFGEIKVIDKSAMYSRHMAEIKKLYQAHGESVDAWTATWLEMAQKHPFGVMVVARKPGKV